MVNKLLRQALFIFPVVVFFSAASAQESLEGSLDDPAARSLDEAKPPVSRRGPLVMRDPRTGMLTGVACNTHARALKVIAKWKETLRFTGLSQNGRLIELFMSDKGTYTLVETKPKGLKPACFINVGHGQIVNAAIGTAL